MFESLEISSNLANKKLMIDLITFNKNFQQFDKNWNFFFKTYMSFRNSSENSSRNHETEHSDGEHQGLKTTGFYYKYFW